MQTLLSKFDVHRITFIDDAVGGATETGTVVASSVPGHIHVRQPSQIMLEQGLETPTICDVFLRPIPGTLLIYERDQIEVVHPPDHPQLGIRWRVEGVQEPDMHPRDRRRFIKVRCTRVKRSRSSSAVT